MYGCVSTWSSQMPRPQKRHAPTAVRRQCQQSISVLPSVRLDPAQAHLRLQRALPEGVADERVEALPVETVRANGRPCPDRRRAGDVEQQRDLPDVGAGADRADLLAVLDDLHLAGPDRVEGEARFALLGGRLAGRNVHPIPVLEQLDQLD